MFGTYEDFPESHHGVARFTYACPIKELQRIIIYSLYQFNLGKGKLISAKPSRSDVKNMLEFGVADGLSFDYIDGDTCEYCQESVSKKMFSTLDFLCIARYYIAQKGRQNPLRFDYYILRFLFYENKVELQVFHEKGTQRLSIEDLIATLIKNFNQELKKKKMSRMKEDYIRAL